MQLGEIRGWGVSGEPLSASQAATWAEHGSTVWGKIFDHALIHRTDFSMTPEVLPIPTIVPEFDEVQEGKINGPTLRGSGIAHWDVRMSIAGLVGSTATTSSECILGVTTAITVSLNNNYPKYPERSRDPTRNTCDSELSSPLHPCPLSPGWP